MKEKENSEKRIKTLADEYQSGNDDSGDQAEDQSEDSEQEENQNGGTSEEKPVDENELRGAREFLISLGLEEKDLEGMTDQEIIDLADEYKKKTKTDRPPGNSPGESSA